MAETTNYKIQYPTLNDAPDINVLGTIAESVDGELKKVEDKIDTEIVEGGKKIEKPTTATGDNVALFDTDENKLKDSGINISELLTGTDSIIKVGTYVGNRSSSKDIVIDFTPKAVLVLREGHLAFGDNNGYGGLALTGVSAKTPYGADCVRIITNGFRVYWNTSNYQYSNDSQATYHYVAIA